MGNSPLKLYELVGADKSQGFSPYVCRVRMAIAHLGLEDRLEKIPLHFHEMKQTFSFTDVKTVPVLCDGDHAVGDSWDIACYLEDEYATSENSLFGGEAGKAHCRMMDHYLLQSVMKVVFPALCYNIFELIAEEDKPYYRKTREARVGMPLEDLKKHEEPSRLRFLEVMKSFDQQLGEYEYIGGAQPRYSDYMLYGIYYWAEAASDADFRGNLDNVSKWLGRMDVINPDL